MSVLRSLLTAGVLASGLLWSLNGITATPAVQASGDRYEVTQQRNPDAACLDCHKPDTEGMHGKHASVINPNNKLPVTCTNCHGQASPQHREGVKDNVLMPTILPTRRKLAAQAHYWLAVRWTSTCRS